MNKRQFLKKATALGAIPFTLPELLLDTATDLSFEKLPKLENESLWKEVRSHYDLSKAYINLESGYYNIIPRPTLLKLKSHLQKVNFEGSHYMRTQLERDRERVTKRLAEFVGCRTKNLIITRNTTESLDLVISGYPWRAKDEVIYAQQDYGAMKEMFKQVVERHQLKEHLISIPNHPQSDEEIVALYESKISPRTKMIMACHMINITGQILPIKKICDMAHRYGVEVLVDGAHCVGHFDFNIEDLNCDYYGSSLHKWLAAPLGNGLLYIATEHIEKLWPLLADYEKDKTKISRLNHLGTHPAYITLGIENAIEYVNWIGVERKQARLSTLRKYWSDALSDVDNVVINSPRETHRVCGIGNVGLKNMSPKQLSNRLFEEYRIFTVAIDYANVQGCRITPNVFTTMKELDVFTQAIKALAKG
ncbi:MAG: aminotransferase class V-fold PLP-dependent enzyme [Flavobacteriaceae bacterium]